MTNDFYEFSSLDCNFISNRETSTCEKLRSTFCARLCHPSTRRAPWNDGDYGHLCQQDSRNWPKRHRSLIAETGFGTGSGSPHFSSGHIQRFHQFIPTWDCNHKCHKCQCCLVRRQSIRCNIRPHGRISSVQNAEKRLMLTITNLFEP